MPLFRKKKHPEEPLYEYVTALHLTTEELCKSGFPDSYLLSVSIAFTSTKGAHYQVVYVSSDKGESTVSLEGLDKEDFACVERVIADLTGGRPKNNPHTGPKCICGIIDLPYSITQSNLAATIENFRLSFYNVIIAKTSYAYVPRSICENSGLPLEKLVLGRLLDK